MFTGYCCLYHILNQRVDHLRIELVRVEIVTRPIKRGSCRESAFEIIKMHILKGKKERKKTKKFNHNILLHHQF